MYVWVNLHFRQGSGRPGQLLMHLLHVIIIDMYVAKRMHEVAGLQIRDLGHHQRQQSIGRDIKRHSEKNIR